MDRKLMGKLIYFLLTIWSGFLISGLNGLQKDDVTLVVPQVILQGGTLNMDCRFPSNESSSISSVKWYKGSREFFRYTPRQHPKAQVIPFKDIDIHVDENQSDLNKIVVKEVPAAFRGNISCEVTLEHSYRSIVETKYLLVAVPPVEDPELTVDVMRKHNTSIGLATWHQGLRTKNDPVTGTDESNIVNIGDTIVARCSSGPSTPPVTLKFFINDYDSTENYQRGVSIKQELKDDGDNRTATRILTMNVTLQYSHFRARQIHIRCKASLFHLYNASSIEVIKELPRESHVTAAGYGNNNNSLRLHHGFGFGNMVLQTLILILLSTTSVFRL